MTAMAVKVDVELIAAAAAAHVLGAKLVRRDTGGRQIRDFDLVLPNGSYEPLEVTRHVDQPAYETWERVGSGLMPTPLLTRVWTIAIPASTPTKSGREPYDVRKLRREIESVLLELEHAGHTTINLGRLEHELPSAFRVLLDLRIQDGISRLPHPGEQPHISYNAPVGGITLPDLVAVAIEAEAAKPDNRKKLSDPPGAAQRHLVVPFDVTSGSAFNAADRAMIGRLPNLPAPITTAWALARGQLLVTMPPDPWAIHQIPRAVFDSPAAWLM
jgi:hypothetical protein